MRRINWYYIAAVVASGGSFLVDYFYHTTYWTIAFSSVGIGYAYNGWVRAKYHEIIAQGEFTTKLQAIVLSRLRIFSVASFVALISLAAAFVVVVQQTNMPDMRLSFSPVVIEELAILAGACYGLLTLGSAELLLVLGNFAKLDYRSFHRPTFAAERLPFCFGLCLLGSLVMLYGTHSVFAVGATPVVSASPQTIFFFRRSCALGTGCGSGVRRFRLRGPHRSEEVGEDVRRGRTSARWNPILDTIPQPDFTWAPLHRNEQAGAQIESQNSNPLGVFDPGSWSGFPGGGAANR